MTYKYFLISYYFISSTNKKKIFRTSSSLLLSLISFSFQHQKYQYLQCHCAIAIWLLRQTDDYIMLGKKSCIIPCLCSGRALFSPLSALPTDCRQAETSLNFLLYNQLRHPVSWSGYACQEVQEFLEMFVGRCLSGIQAAHHRNLLHHPINKQSIAFPK